MKVQKRASRLANLKIFRLYQDSVIHECLGWIRLGGKYPFDDRVSDLRGKPLGMFFYNQRAIFFLIALMFLFTLLFLVSILNSTTEMIQTVGLLTVVWFIGVLLTISLHPIFKRKLRNWAPAAAPVEYPPMFDLYFLLDWLLIFGLVVVGRQYQLKVDTFTFLLFANTIVYSTYIRHSRNLARILSVSGSLLVITYLLYPGIGVAKAEPSWFYSILYLGPIICTLATSVGLVMGISLLRTFEQQVTQRRLELLGDYENILSPSKSPPHSDQVSAPNTSTSGTFEESVRGVLDSMCSQGTQFWYDAACLWIIEEHETRGQVLLPSAEFGFKSVEAYRNGIELRNWLSPPDTPRMIPSLRLYIDSHSVPEPQFRIQQDAPAAFIPVTQGETCAGVLSLYGKETGPPMQRQEWAFLNSLAAIISNAMEQWQARTRASAQMEMDKLFKLQNLDEVFRQAAKIMRTHLLAAGCMVIFRRNPEREDMEVTAWAGVTDSILDSKYRVGEGLTGKCAEIGTTIRCDDVQNNQNRFDPELLANLQLALQDKIVSWMAIPIGPTTRNYGVIKVVNRTARCLWFTKEDQRLGESLAFALQVIVEKFLQVEMLAAATNEATRQSSEARLKSEDATRERKKAEDVAASRQQELMIITHQLQAPLSAVVSALSSLQSQGLTQFMRRTLDYVQALVEDGLTLCYGTTTSFVIAAGKRTHFDVADIDAPSELKKLCSRLQITNARHDLNFAYYKDPGFPTVQMDRDVFTSVLYSLIHNAMKYSDEFSQVSLMCKFMDGKPVLEVSSQGEPILSAESEDIFLQYKRGKVVEETGRHHRGVGLGLWVARNLLRELGGDLTVILPPQHRRLSIFVVHFPENKSRGKLTIVNRRGNRTSQPSS